MGYKHYGLQDFYAKTPAGNYAFNCHAENTRYGFRHLCDVFFEGRFIASAKRCYYNRTWERFTYESVLIKAIEECPEECQAVLRAVVIEKIAKKGKADAEKFIAEFEAEYKKSTPGMKKALAAAGPIENEKQAEEVMGLMKAANLMQEIK